MSTSPSRAWALLLLPAAGALLSAAIGAASPEVERGKYLVGIAGCSHCHTPGHFFGKDDMSRYLAGSDVGLSLSSGATVFGNNLTPDQETGLGRWSIQDLVRAIQSGVTPDGRVLSAVMPWPDYHGFTPADARAIALYLKSLPPIRNEVPGALRPDQKPATFHISLVPLPTSS